MEFLDLTDDSIFEIFRHLTARDICHCARVCKRLNELSKNNYLWYLLFMKYQGKTV